MIKMKIKWTTKDIDTDKVIKEWTADYSRSELLEVFDKSERLAIKEPKHYLALLSKRQSIGFILDSRYHELRIHK